MKLLRHITDQPGTPGTLPALLCLWVALCISGAVEAQETSPLKPSTDGELWMSISGSYQPFKKKGHKYSSQPLLGKLQFQSDLGWRATLEPFTSKQVYGTFGAKLRLTDFLRVGSEYRYSARDKYSSNTSRIDLQLWLNWTKDRVRLDHRFMYQHDFVDVTKVRSVLRNRLTVEYNIPGWKLDPHFSAEAFTGLHYTGNDLVGMRYELGTELDLDKKKTRSLEVAVRYGQELHTANPQNRWIFVVAYGHEFKKK